MIDPARAEVHVVIRSKDGIERAAPLVWERDGLGVHETPRLRSEARVIWSVTHVLSGFALVRAARSGELASERVRSETCRAHQYEGVVALPHYGAASACSSTQSRLRVRVRSACAHGPGHPSASRVFVASPEPTRGSRVHHCLGRAVAH